MEQKPRNQGCLGMIGIGQGVGLVVDVRVVGDCALLAYQEDAGSKGSPWKGRHRRHRLVYLPAELQYWNSSIFYLGIDIIVRTNLDICKYWTRLNTRILVLLQALSFSWTQFGYAGRLPFRKLYPRPGLFERWITLSRIHRYPCNSVVCFVYTYPLWATGAWAIVVEIGGSFQHFANSHTLL